MERFVFRNGDHLYLIEKVLVSAKEQMIKSNCAYVPPPHVSYLMKEFSALKKIIESYQLAKDVFENKTNKLMIELKEFGINQESIKII